MTISTKESAVAKELNRYCIEGMSETLINAIISLLGGDEGFLHTYKEINEKGALMCADPLFDREIAFKFFLDHKKDLLSYIKESGYKRCDNSLLESVMKDMYDGGHNIDDVAIALFSDISDVDGISNTHAHVARVVSCIAVNDVVREYYRIYMAKRFVARQIARNKERLS